MDYKIVWTEPALANLEGIVVHIARDNPIAAGRVGGEIMWHGLGRNLNSHADGAARRDREKRLPLPDLPLPQRRILDLTCATKGRP